ncbi:MAG: ATP synthase F0 subunit B [bacterium]
MFANTFIVASAAIDFDATLVIQMGLFLLLFMVLKPLLFTPFMKAMDERHQGLEGSREDADEFEARAERALNEYEKKMRDARREATEVRESLRTQGQAEYQDLIGEAREEISAKIETERQSVAAQREEALTQLQGRADDLANTIVGKMLPA